MFPVIFAALLLGIVCLDYICLPKSARRAWRFMALILGGGAAFALYQKPLDLLPKLLGVGRPVDAVLYLVTAILVREFFLSRFRHRETQAQITQLVRELAIERAKH